MATKAVQNKKSTPNIFANVGSIFALMPEEDFNDGEPFEIIESCLYTELEDAQDSADLGEPELVVEFVPVAVYRRKSTWNKST